MPALGDRTLTDMRNRIADELHRSDLTTEIDRQIQSAIEHYETSRFRWNEKKDVAIATTVQGQREYSLSSDFLEFDTLKIVYNGTFIPLRLKTYQWIDENDSQEVAIEGTPAYYTTYGDTQGVLRIFPTDNQTHSLIGAYHYRTALTYTASSSEAWFTQGEELIRSRAKAAVEIFRLQKLPAKQEQLMLAQRPDGTKFYSFAERTAFVSLQQEYNKFASSGKLTPSEIL